MRIGQFVLIINHDEHNNKAAELVEIMDTVYRVKLFETGQELIVKEDNIRRKKSCICGLSKNRPFCDGSHAGGM